MTTPSGAIHCDACPHAIHQESPLLIGPADLSGRLRRFRLCRTCYRRVLEYFKHLRQLARADAVRARAA